MGVTSKGLMDKDNVLKAANALSREGSIEIEASKDKISFRRPGFLEKLFFRLFASAEDRKAKADAACHAIKTALKIPDDHNLLVNIRSQIRDNGFVKGSDLTSQLEALEGKYEVNNGVIEAKKDHESVGFLFCDPYSESLKADRVIVKNEQAPWLEGEAKYLVENDSTLGDIERTYISEVNGNSSVRYRNREQFLSSIGQCKLDGPHIHRFPDIGKIHTDQANNEGLKTFHGLIEAAVKELHGAVVISPLPDQFAEDHDKSGQDSTYSDESLRAQISAAYALNRPYGHKDGGLYISFASSDAELMERMIRLDKDITSSAKRHSAPGSHSQE